MLRALALFCVVALLGACADGARELQKPVEPMGSFKLGHAIVLAPNLTKGPLSRGATPEEWIASVDAALEERFRRYAGPDYYHIGVSVEGYMLARTGIPLVYSPKSALILRVTVFEDATQTKLNAEPEQITVLESISGETLLGSGLTQTRETQMRNLSVNAALQIEKWMRRMQKEKGWFGGLEANEAVAAEMAAGDPGTAGTEPETATEKETEAAADLAADEAETAVGSVEGPVGATGGATGADDILPPLPAPLGADAGAIADGAAASAN